MTRDHNTDQSFVAALERVRAEPGTVEYRASQYAYEIFAAANPETPKVFAAIEQAWADGYAAAANESAAAQIEGAQEQARERSAAPSQEVQSSGRPAALPADPAGHWTREPPTVAGWYWLRYLDTVSVEGNIGYYYGNDVMGKNIERWSIPIPPPEGK